MSGGPAAPAQAGVGVSADLHCSLFFFFLCSIPDTPLGASHDSWTPAPSLSAPVVAAPPKRRRTNSTYPIGLPRANPTRSWKPPYKNPKRRPDLAVRAAVGREKRSTKNAGHDGPPTLAHPQPKSNLDSIFPPDANHRESFNDHATWGHGMEFGRRLDLREDNSVQGRGETYAIMRSLQQPSRSRRW
jgi:hypothetical protein